MKIVDSKNKDEPSYFSELSCGDVFIMGGDVFMRAEVVSEDYAVDLKTGDIHTIQHLQEVTPLPNAELHLNK